LGPLNYWYHIFGFSRKVSEPRICPRNPEFTRVLFVLDSTNNGVSHISKGGKVPNPVGRILSSYRAEATAILSALTHLLPFINYSTVAIFTDSKSNVNTWDKGLEICAAQQIRESDADIWSNIRQVAKKWEGRVLMYWIKAHSDNKDSFENLTLSQKGNVIADRGAEKMYSQAVENEMIPSKIKWTIKLDGKEISGKVHLFLKNHIKMGKSEEFIRRIGNKHGVDLWGRTDWEVVGTVSMGWNIFKRVRALKIIWGLVATARVLFQRGRGLGDDTPNCQLCNTLVDETHWHYMAECTSPTLVKLRMEIHATILHTLTEAGATPGLASILGSIWSPGEVGIYTSMSEEEMKKIVVDWGDEMGWEDNLVKELQIALSQGRWSTPGVIDKAWCCALTESGIGMKGSKRTAKKVVLAMTEGISRIWVERCRLYHKIQTDRDGPVKTSLLSEIKLFLQSERFEGRREHILEHFSLMLLAKIKIKFSKLKSKELVAITKTGTPQGKKQTSILGALSTTEKADAGQKNDDLIPTTCLQTETLKMNNVEDLHSKEKGTVMLTLDTSGTFGIDDAKKLPRCSSEETKRKNRFDRLSSPKKSRRNIPTIESKKQNKKQKTIVSFFKPKQTDISCANDTDYSPDCDENGKRKREGIG
jgi:hypothetical protein